jgi:hypothetical protein
MVLQQNLAFTILNSTATTKYDSYWAKEQSHNSLLVTELQDTAATQPGAC